MVGPKINIIFGVRKRNLVGVMNSIALFVNAQVNAEPTHLYRCGICKTSNYRENEGKINYGVSTIIFFISANI